MSETVPKCPRCGTPLPPDAPEGLCPRCLVALNLATQTDVAGEIGPGGTAVNKPPPPSPLPPAEIARLFPQLEILECLGRGGMGAVYKARQPRLDRFVALKILSPEKQDDPKFAERFEREARALARLNHPNIVAVYDFGFINGRRGNEADVSQSATAPPPQPGGGENKAGGLYYLLMEFVDGLTLRQLFHTRKLSPAEALGIVPKICEALQYAHNEGIVHRDIKPENILLDKKGQVKIADFGIAKIIGQAPSEVSLTGAKDVVGTPHYMAPEQIEKPATVDHRADIYSLGVVFYEMLTGELPLGKFQPPSSRMRGMQIDVRLDEVVLHALEKEPERRYQQASQVKTAVETIAAGAAKPVTLPPVSSNVSIRHQVKLPAIGLAVTGALNWVLSALLFIAMGLIILSETEYQPNPGIPYATRGPIILVILLAMLVNGFIIYGALKMMRLERWRAGVAASLLAMIVAPANLIGLPIGIWALVVLGRREVREAMTAPPRPSGRKVKFAIGAVAALILGVAAWLGLDVFAKGPERCDAPFPVRHVRQQIDAHLHAAQFRWRTTRLELMSDNDGSFWYLSGLKKLAAGGDPKAAASDPGILRLVSAGSGRWLVQGEKELSGIEFEVTEAGDPAAAVPEGSGFSPVVERVIRQDEADEQGFVFFDIETGRTLPPPFALVTRSNRDPAFVELPAALEQWILANRMDVLIHFAGENWSRMNLRMQEDFIPEAVEWDLVTTGKVADVFARWDAASPERAEVPAASQGRGFQDQFDRPKAFRTRSNTEGVMQWAGQSTTPRSVKIRYRLVEASNPKSSRSLTASNRLLHSPTDPAGPTDNPQLEQDPGAAIAETIRTRIGQDLTAVGASYDDLQVTTAVKRDSATPFKVSYRGLRNFKWGNGAAPATNGEFIMEYIGGGRWQGKLGGMQFTVPVGQTDDFTLPFVNDPQVIGEWESVDFVADPSDFNPDKPNSTTGGLYLKGLTFRENGKTANTWETWTKGIVIHQGDKTASHYEIRELKGQLYMFFEWKSGDVMVLGKKPSYYVLKKKL
jgi:serine/threonine protein kinase